MYAEALALLEESFEDCEPDLYHDEPALRREHLDAYVARIQSILDILHEEVAICAAMACTNVKADLDADDDNDDNDEGQ